MCERQKRVTKDMNFRDIKGRIYSKNDNNKKIDDDKEKKIEEEERKKKKIGWNIKGKIRKEEVEDKKGIWVCMKWREIFVVGMITKRR